MIDRILVCLYQACIHAGMTGIVMISSGIIGYRITVYGLGPPAAKKVHFFLAFPSTFLVKLGGFHIFVLTYASPRSPLRAEYFGTRIGPVR